MKPHIIYCTMSIAALFLSFGCEAEGVFPNCGNGQLDLALGEECDENQFPTTGFSCQLQGFNTGYLQCKSNCELDFSQCEGYRACDPVANFGCSGGESCYYFPRTIHTNCAATGAVELGLSCSLSPNCSPKMVCVDKKCRDVCAADELCSNGNACITQPDEPYGYCSY